MRQDTTPTIPFYVDADTTKHLVDAQGNPTHVITRDASGGYTLTPIEDE